MCYYLRLSIHMILPTIFVPIFLYLNNFRSQWNLVLVFLGWFSRGHFLSFSKSSSASFPLFTTEGLFPMSWILIDCSQIFVCMFPDCLPWKLFSLFPEIFSPLPSWGSGQSPKNFLEVFYHHVEISYVCHVPHYKSKSTFIFSNFAPPPSHSPLGGRV